MTLSTPVLPSSTKSISRFRLVIAILLLLSHVYPASSQTITTTKDQVITILKKVNDYWQKNNSTNVRAFWDNAAYHTGNMEAYQITGSETYRIYSENWAKYNNWMGATGTDKTKWKSSYGETADYVLFGDWQICFQTYVDLYNIDIQKNLTPDNTKIARAREVMEYEMSTSKNNYWWWADGLYMVMPVMVKLYKVTGNQLYLDKLFEYFTYADNLMYDSAEKLYYRDGSYVYPAHTTLAGKKDFWSRGNGWVFAGLAKVLKDLPANDTHRAFYENRFKGMAEALIAIQQTEGYWTRSLQDVDQASGRETSGTAFFTYGLLLGINNGYLDRNTYLPAAALGWSYLSTIALQTNGSVGYVQPIGSAAVPGQIVSATNTANFGVGAFLLAASELTRLQGLPTAVNATKQASEDIRAYPNPTTDQLMLSCPSGFYGDITLLDITGKTLQTIGSSEQKIINMTSYAPGIYFVKANNKTLKVVRK